MQNVDDLLDEVKWKHGIKSDYKLAHFLKMTPNTIANYRHGRSRPDDKTLLKLADLAGLDQYHVDVLAVQLHAERTTDATAKEFWNRIVVRLQGGAVHAAVLMAIAIVSIAGYAPNAEATALNTSKAASSSMYIM